MSLVDWAVFTRGGEEIARDLWYQEGPLPAMQFWNVSDPGPIPLEADDDDPQWLFRIAETGSDCETVEILYRIAPGYLAHDGQQPAVCGRATIVQEVEELSLEPFEGSLPDAELEVRYLSIFEVMEWFAEGQREIDSNMGAVIRNLVWRSFGSASRTDSLYVLDGVRTAFEKYSALTDIASQIRADQIATTLHASGQIQGDVARVASAAGMSETGTQRARKRGRPAPERI